LLTTKQALALSDRQREVMAELASGKLMSEVATALTMTVNTVRSHLNEVRGKLGARELPALVHCAYRTGALPRPAPDPHRPDISLDQWAVLHHIAAGRTARQMTTELRRPLTVVRKDARDLLDLLQARNPGHAISRAWQLGMLGGQDRQEARDMSRLLDTEITWMLEGSRIQACWTKQTSYRCAAVCPALRRREVQLSIPRACWRRVETDRECRAAQPR
jgi:DNA-binding CsgD family transcriptional regulator